MSQGIAVHFKRRFGRIDQLLRQNQKSGGLASLFVEGRWIFYLVTKDHYYQKPNNRVIFNSLRRLRDFVDENEVNNLAIPKIACGRDHKNWKLIKPMICFLFRHSSCQLYIYDVVRGIFSRHQTILRIRTCVSRDFRMSQGIAVHFKRSFGRIDQLLRQNQKSGGLANLFVEGRWIFYLVTKDHYYQKPNNRVIFNNLRRLRDFVDENEVNNLTIPKIACVCDPNAS
nr:uncharacterized protein LOC111513613 [Leptinotarsa decemlineata]